MALAGEGTRPTALACGSVASLSADARRWFVLAIGSLIVAGLLSLSVVIGRLPVISRFIDDPLFFKRCLVVHVDLALVVWFYSFLAALSAVRVGRAIGGVGRAAFVVSVAGVAAMLAGASVRDAEPVLANYVPVIDHPLFLAGLAAFFLGALVFLLETLATAAHPRPGSLPPDAAIGLQAAAVAFVLAGATWLATRAGLPDGLDTWTRHEFSTWGAGHVLQVANICAMLAVWLWLLRLATGRALLGTGAARAVFTLLVAPHFAMPLLTLRGPLDPLYHNGATLLMRWGIFPIVLTVLVLGVRHLWRERSASAITVGRALRPTVLETSATGVSGINPDLQQAFRGDVTARLARAGFYASAALTTLGFVLGACIRSSTTLVPAHYHASLGGVTAAFMAAAYLICQQVGPALRAGLSSSDENTPGDECHRTPPLKSALLRSARAQLIAFGIGQAVFALGFAIGGAYGLGRKAYAGEQHVRSAGEYFGLGVMGLGGLAAAGAGLWFLFLILRELRGWLRARSSAATATAASQTSLSTP